MKLSQIKSRIVECLTRDVRRKAEEAEAEQFAAHLQLDSAHHQLREAECLAERLQEMDRRNHYSQSLVESYRPKERPI
ncbi:hypothetical protein PP641_gp038 [Arthrobacter phage SilentRX]|uniref:Uncharacterized protein n=1 Tax=Arthrobacter phage SilentRX TaxID=2836091 RepID=A0A8F3IP61_9CAUD|nr:hypothetical protein PP641_gp038 [Arthrobacter phage SilentRX]QWY82778.1 hypothetical protein SEA_SILENTRX_38 [Arthrobacter phage SilentRX]